jgi:hypothetical protein
MRKNLLIGSSIVSLLIGIVSFKEIYSRIEEYENLREDYRCFYRVSNKMIESDCLDEKIINESLKDIENRIKNENFENVKREFENLNNSEELRRNYLDNLRYMVSCEEVKILEENKCNIKDYKQIFGFLEGVSLLGVLYSLTAGCRNRTCAGTKPLPPQGSPFDRSGNPA